MKKVKVIYNPSSGRQLIQKRIDEVCKILMDNGYLVGKYATQKKNDAMLETVKCCGEDWDIIVACGGDGTVNEIASGIIKGGRKVPVAILAAGTVNDFANYMEIPTNPREFCEMIMGDKTIDVDMGEFNGKYFVNVAAGGLLTNVAHQVSPELKTILGRMAYYIEGLKEIPKQGLKPIDVKIYSDEYVGEEKILLFLISNSSSIGGFKRMAHMAQVEDGYLDCILIKDSKIQDIISVFLKILMGEIASHPNVIYFKTKEIRIESIEKVHVDIDGEYGGTLSSSFKVVPHSFRIFVK